MEQDAPSFALTSTPDDALYLDINLEQEDTFGLLNLGKWIWIYLLWFSN
jgi:hypothetical protein